MTPPLSIRRQLAIAARRQWHRQRNVRVIGYSAKESEWLRGQVRAIALTEYHIRRASWYRGKLMEAAQ